jgi:hypothetical protein
MIVWLLVRKLLRVPFDSFKNEIKSLVIGSERMCSSLLSRSMLIALSCFGLFTENSSWLANSSFASSWIKYRSTTKSLREEIIDERSITLSSWV